VDIVQREILREAAGAALRADLDADSLSRISASVHETDFIIGAVRVTQAGVALVAPGEEHCTAKESDAIDLSRS